MDKLVKKDEGILYQTPIFQDESESESAANLILPIRKLLRTSMEDTAASDLRALRSTIDVLGLDKAANIVSEITVERYWGKVLPHIFVQPGTFLCSNTSLVYPPDFNCWDSAPQPDLGTRLILPDSYLTPVLLVGEAKTLATKELDIRAQMACAAHPTLQLFVSHLTKKYKDEETEKWDKDFDPFAQGDKQGQIPEHIYTLVPKDGSVMGPSGNDEAQEDPDGEDEVTYRDHSNDPRKMKVVWQYNCLDIDEFRSASELAILGTDTWLSSRILLLVVGLVLKKQLQKTLEALKREPLQLPEQLTELDKAFVALRKDSK
ncbi:hypothetical protein EWM64_g6646 [Hericium alpestre]|uniref:Uncharacterized protein n=1 Tax=Hericium alpestre TaxID=135208 RepID=A0A4Y9ZS03_9AGAM|nr:hypothetical protein EWM64_g6646 [Hericium alpestre]